MTNNTNEKTESGQMPSILTNSLSAVIAFYGNNIVELRAKSSKQESEWGSGCNNIGFDIGSERTGTARINYRQNRDGDGVATNGLGDERERLFKTLEQHYEDCGIVDLSHVDMSVEKMTVEIVSDELELLLPKADSNVFDFVFKSVPANVPLGGVNGDTKTLGLNQEAGLVRPGYEPRDLDLIAVYETREVHGPISAEPLIQRANNTSLPECDNYIADKIVEAYLLVVFGYKKQYLRVEEDAIRVY